MNNSSGRIEFFLGSYASYQSMLAQWKSDGLITRIEFFLGFSISYQSMLAQWKSDGFIARPCISYQSMLAQWKSDGLITRSYASYQSMLAQWKSDGFITRSSVSYQSMLAQWKSDGFIARSYASYQSMLAQWKSDGFMTSRKCLDRNEDMYDFLSYGYIVLRKDILYFISEHVSSVKSDVFITQLFLRSSISYQIMLAQWKSDGFIASQWKSDGFITPILERISNHFLPHFQLSTFNSSHIRPAPKPNKALATFNLRTLLSTVESR
ncbi:hypothetical protein V8E54_005551 [Elaphomyces granulatus]